MAELTESPLPSGLTRYVVKDGSGVLYAGSGHGAKEAAAAALDAAGGASKPKKARKRPSKASKR